MKMALSIIALFMLAVALLRVAMFVCDAWACFLFPKWSHCGFRGIRARINAGRVSESPVMIKVCALLFVLSSTLSLVLLIMR